MDSQTRPAFEGGRDGWQPRDFDREDGGRLEPPARDESLAAAQRRALDAGEIQAYALARLCVSALLAVDFESPHPHVETPGKERERVLGREAPAVERARHDGAEALHREGAVEEDASGAAAPVLARNARSGRGELTAQGGEPRPVSGGLPACAGAPGIVTRSEFQ